MDPQHTEGIILKIVPFKDYDQILTVFTKDFGTITILNKNSRQSTKQQSSSYLSPLVRIELILQQGRTDLFFSREISILDQYPRLRNDLSRLETAFELIQMINSTQFPNKPAPLLYQLLTKSLLWISEIKDPNIIGASFRLKLLRYEGLFDHSDICTTCQSVLKDRILFKGESFCTNHIPAFEYKSPPLQRNSVSPKYHSPPLQHSPLAQHSPPLHPLQHSPLAQHSPPLQHSPNPLYISEEEYQYIFILAFCRNINDLRTLEISSEIIEKIKKTFDSIFFLA